MIPDLLSLHLPLLGTSAAASSSPPPSWSSTSSIGLSSCGQCDRQVPLTIDWLRHLKYIQCILDVDSVLFDAKILQAIKYTFRRCLSLWEVPTDPNPAHISGIRHIISNGQNTIFLQCYLSISDGACFSLMWNVSFGTNLPLGIFWYVSKFALSCKHQIITKKLNPLDWQMFEVMTYFWFWDLTQINFDFGWPA